MAKLFLLRLIKSGASRMLASYSFGFVTQGLYFIVLARALGAAEFGLFAGALALTSVMASLVGAGSGNVLVLRTASDPRLLGVQTGTALVYIFVTALPFAAIAFGIGSLVGPAFLSVLLPLIFSEIFTLRIFDLAQQIFQATDQLGRTALCGIVASSMRVLTVVIFSVAITPTAISWSFWYAATTAASALAVMTWALRSAGRPVWSRVSLLTTWRLGVFFSLGTASRTIYTDSDKFILSSYGLLSASGALSAASKIITMAFAPVQALVYSLNTRLFRAGTEGSQASWRLIRRPLVLISIYGVACGIFLWLVNPYVPVLLGPSYKETAGYLILLAPLIVLNGVHYLFGDALMGLGRQSLRSLLQFLTAVLAVVANVVLIPIFGVHAALGTALACSLFLAASMAVTFARIYRAAKRQPAELELSISGGHSHD